MQQIGEKTIRKGGDMCRNAMLAYQSKINEAFINNGEKDLKIGLSLTITPGAGAGNFKLKADISFITQKITDSFTDNVDEVQGDLFDQGTGDLKKCPLRPEDMIFASFCNDKCPLRSEVVSHGSVDEDGAPWTYTRSCSTWADDDKKEHIEKMLEWEPGVYSDVIDSGEGFKFYDPTAAEPKPAKVYPMKAKKYKVAGE